MTIVSVYTNGPKYEESNGFMEDPNTDSVKTVQMLGVNEGHTVLYTDGYCSEDMNDATLDTESEHEEENTESVNWKLYSGTKIYKLLTNIFWL